MENQTNVYKRVSELSKNATSSRSRIVAVILAFILPVGTHNFYLGYYVKGIVQFGIALFLSLIMPPFISVFIFPAIWAWMTYEGLTYLLWYQAKDGDGFLFEQLEDKPEPKKWVVILLSFIFPFGLHHIYLGNKIRGILEWGFVAYVAAILIQHYVIEILWVSPAILFLIIGISWLEGIWFLLTHKRLRFN